MLFQKLGPKNAVFCIVPLSPAHLHRTRMTGFHGGAEFDWMDGIFRSTVNSVTPEDPVN